MTSSNGTTANDWTAHGMTGSVTAGDTIDFDGQGHAGDITIMFSYTPVNALIGTYKLSAVTA
jgi:hypothetical protein